MDERIGDRLELIRTYLEDGAYSTAGKLLEESIAAYRQREASARLTAEELVEGMPQDQMDEFAFSVWLAIEHKKDDIARQRIKEFCVAQIGKHFSLFNVGKWLEDYDNAKPLCPSCCRVVPVLYRGMFDTAFINSTMTLLEATGSKAAPGFMKPEGIVIYHEAARTLFKKTFENDETGKGK